MHYFELFSLAPEFSIDKDVLIERFHQLQARYHPDNFSSHTEREKALALQRSFEINRGYQTLLRPESRAQYLMELSGIDLANETQTLKDNEFLMVQLVLREELESIESEESIDSFARKIKALQSQIERDFAGHYQAGKLELAADAARKMQFYVRLCEQMHQLEDNILDW